MLEEPKRWWERTPPLVLAGVVAAVLCAAGAALILPKLGAPGKPSPAAVSGPASGGPEAPQAAEADKGPQDQWIEWEAGTSPATYHIGGFDLHLSGVLRDDLNAVKLEAFTQDGAATELVGDGTSWTARADLAVVGMDASSPERQLLFASFTGGAHCCTTLTMLTVGADGWKRIELGQWDGDTPPLPRDLDGDGRKEFVFRDQLFLYAFDSYAGSWAPPKVMAVVNGRVVDLSSERRFRSVFQNELNEAREACGQRSNGACAGYVAMAARVGRLDEAWAFMLASYDQTSGWIYPAACRVRSAAECPAGAELKFETFPESLQWFLGDAGYSPASYVEPLNAHGPSFPCGAARKTSERQICANEALGALDRLMARAFTRAMALTPDRAALRASQRDFLSERDNASEPGVLESLYSRRIRELMAV